MHESVSVHSNILRILYITPNSPPPSFFEPSLSKLHLKEDGRWTTRAEIFARHPIIGGVKDERGGEVAPFAVVLGRSGGQQGSLRRRFRAKYRERAGGRAGEEGGTTHDDTRRNPCRTGARAGRARWLPDSARRRRGGGGMGRSVGASGRAGGDY